MMNRQMRRAVISAVVAAGIITPAQSKELFIPKAPAIIKPAGFWKPYEDKQQKLFLSSMTMGLLIPSGVLVPSYRATYTDTTDRAGDYTFATSDLGVPDTTRMIVIGVQWTRDGGTHSATTVDGTAAVIVNTERTAGPAGRLSMWRAASTANATGDIVITVNGALNMTIHVWALYPSSQIPVDDVGVQGNSSTFVLTDLAKTNGGFTCLIGGSRRDGASGSWSQTGAETITENHDSLVETSVRTAASHVNTATTTTDDYTYTNSASGEGYAIGATWF